MFNSDPDLKHNYLAWYQLVYSHHCLIDWFKQANKQKFKLSENESARHTVKALEFLMQQYAGKIYNFC